ncbi:unnamed protein product [Ceratitis capitata]|uniref:(Mediterranean fruit fly) hypothetical protein n=1 Tax=Ceratitis capitata TaxID=7213 RepID=A0A811V2A1_CERCA|nr:unnamed protein product [Ceratitis capitata]
MTLKHTAILARATTEEVAELWLGVWADWVLLRRFGATRTPSATFGISLWKCVWLAELVGCTRGGGCLARTRLTSSGNPQPKGVHVSRVASLVKLRCFASRLCGGGTQ